MSSLEHPHPCSGLAGLQEEFLTAAAAFKQSDSLSLLRTVCSWNHNLTTTHVEIFYLREITGVSSPFFFFLFLSDFDARCCLLSSLSQHSPNLLHISFGARCKSCRRRYGSASRSADNQRRDDSFCLNLTHQNEGTAAAGGGTAAEEFDSGRGWL